MAKLIAMAGKGGTGKTTFAALIIRSLLRQGHGPVLAVDADPNATLPEALGIPMPTTMGEIREQFGKTSESLPAGMTKGQWFEYQLNTILVEAEGFDLLVMGRQEGPGCYCYINNLLRGAVEQLQENYRYVVVDNEAGLEHLSRRNASEVDLLVVISDHSVRGVRSSHRVLALAEEMGIEVKRSAVLINRVGSATGEPNLEQVDDAVRQEARRLGIEIFSTIPDDPEVARADLEQRSLLELEDETPAARAAGEVARKLIGS